MYNVTNTQKVTASPDTWAGLPARQDGSLEDALWQVPQTMADSIMESIQKEAQAALAAGVIDPARMESGMAEVRIRLTRALVEARHYVMGRRTQLLAVASGVTPDQMGAKLATLAITAKFIADCFGDDAADQAHGVTVMAGACAEVGAKAPTTWDEVLKWII